MKDQMEIRFFLGSNTKRGFVPLFNKLKDPKGSRRFYILKGGPGSGKSTLMKRITKTLVEQNHFVEYMPCASDPESLDAIYDHDAHIAIADGTAPHTLDPDYPGAYDMIINLGEAWTSESIRQNKNEIIELSHDISKCHQMATACIKSAAALLDHNRLTAREYVKQETVDAWVQTIIKNLDEAEPGCESHRLLSAVTVGKTLFFRNTIKSLCPRLYTITDEWGAASGAILSDIRDYAVRKRIAFITCYCSIDVPDKIDHILFPSIGLGISTSNSYHMTDGKYKLTADELMKPVKNYDLESLTRHCALARELIKTAEEHVAKAKVLHDELEKYYIGAMNFSKVDQIYHKLIDDIMKSKN